MSRNALPASKLQNAPARYKKQVCIYGFTQEELKLFASYGCKSALEDCEDIEILRFLELTATFRCTNAVLVATRLMSRRMSPKSRQYLLNGG